MLIKTVRTVLHWLDCLPVDKSPLKSEKGPTLALMLVPARSRIGWIFSSMKVELLLIHIRTWVRYHSG